jgi:hypothetical protein
MKCSPPSRRRRLSVTRKSFARTPAIAAHRTPDAGSPWLWVALAGVVAVLLVIVAKLLPSQDSDGGT